MLPTLNANDSHSTSEIIYKNVLRTILIYTSNIMKILYKNILHSAHTLGGHAKIDWSYREKLNTLRKNVNKINNLA